MSDGREALLGKLTEYYRACGWKVRLADDGTVRATGVGDVTWIGLPVVVDDFDDPAFASRLKALSEERMPTGQLCPLELLPAAECADDLRALLDALSLRERGHVEVYAVAA